MKRKAIAAGHICIDITPAFPGAPVNKVSQLLRPGKMVQTKGVSIHTGGSVANTGLAMKIFGADVSLMGKVGDDEFGRMILEALGQYNADRGMIVSEDDETSYTVILSIPGIDRIFLHDPGANNTFSGADIPDSALKGISLFHFGYPTSMKKMYENDGEELVALFQRVKAKGIVTSLDLSGIDPDSDVARADWNRILRRVLPYVDFFVPSAEELCFMIDRERFGHWQELAGEGDITALLDPERDIEPLADRCLAWGAGVVLIKSGAPGMFCKTASREKLEDLCQHLALDVNAWASYRGFERSYVPDRVVSGTGAGDTSIAAFLTSALNGESLAECLRMATAAGACCVTGLDALSGLMSLEEMKAKIREGWRKTEK